jgi:hypothetical protein
MDEGRGKGENFPVLSHLNTTPWSLMGEWMYKYLYSWPRHKIYMSGLLHSLAVLPAGKEPPVTIG